MKKILILIMLSTTFLLSSSNILIYKYNVKNWKDKRENLDKRITEFKNNPVPENFVKVQKAKNSEKEKLVEIDPITNIRYCPKAKQGTIVKQDNQNWYIRNSSSSIKYKIFNENFRVNRICTTHITSMSSLFKDTDFNQSISNWDLSNVTNTREMFKNNSRFNQDLSSLSFSSVTDAKEMFYNRVNFNNKNKQMFVSFPNLVLANKMFYNRVNFNVPVFDFNMRNLKDSSYMFYNRKKFNQDISSWNLENLENRESMFNNRYKYNNANMKLRIKSRKLKNVGNMFNNSRFNQAIEIYSSSLTNLDYMFYNSNFNQDISNWDTSNVLSMNYMFKYSRFNQDISNWCVEKIKNEPQNFKGVLMTDNQKNPKWGTCP